MEILTRDQILGAEDLQFERVPVPEWGGFVVLRGLTGSERDRFEASMVKIRGRTATQNLENVRARLVALSAVDNESPNASRLFTPGDVAKLGKKSGAVLDRLFDVARRLSGLSEQDVQEIVQDFGDGLNADSGSI